MDIGASTRAKEGTTEAKATATTRATTATTATQDEKPSTINNWLDKEIRALLRMACETGWIGL